MLNQQEREVLGRKTRETRELEKLLGVQDGCREGSCSQRARLGPPTL